MAVIGVVAHPSRRECRKVADTLTAWLAERGHVVLRAPDEGGVEGCERPELPGEGLDLVVSLGGDGTMLRSVELAAPAGAPVLGVNLGDLGYLTEIEAAGMEAALERFLKGDYELEERMTLEVQVEPGESRDPGLPEGPVLALNEAVLEKTMAGHTVRLAAEITGRPFITYAADGVLVATPTGSTAYNLSVHGPVLSPLLSALIVTPISPHMLFDRSLVLEPSQWVRLEVRGNRPAVLVVDGSRIGEIAPGDAIVCRRGRSPARLVVFGQSRDFHSILKAKFGLTDR